MKNLKIGILSLLILGASIASCKKKGCLDNDADNYNILAQKSDGYCTYRYFSKITVNASTGITWDVLSNPDMYVQFSKSSSSTWDYTTSTLNNSYATVWTITTDIQMTNESWDFRVMDENSLSADDVMITGSFNPLIDGMTFTSNNGTITFEYEVKLK